MARQGEAKENFIALKLLLLVFIFEAKLGLVKNIFKVSNVFVII